MSQAASCSWKIHTSGSATNPSWAWPDTASELVEPICFLLNEFIRTETFPAELKRTDIPPLFKKGLDDPLKYRPISLTPALAKVFESLIKQQIDEYIHKNSLLSKTQFCAADALVYLSEKNPMQQKRKNYCGSYFKSIEIS